jgi:hypothetical protein
MKPDPLSALRFSETVQQVILLIARASVRAKFFWINSVAFEFLEINRSLEFLAFE